MLRASIMLRRNTSTAAAMVPSSSRRSLPGMVTSVSPLERRFMTAVIGGERTRQAAAEQERQHDGAPARMATVPRIRLRCDVAAAASYSVVSLMTSSTPTGWPA